MVNVHNGFRLFDDSHLDVDLIGFQQIRLKLRENVSSVNDPEGIRALQSCTIVNEERKKNCC